ncbi:ATP-binding cassette sub-family C member 11-like [Pteropus medius]|uniref:ATP-binding cassette sub-family C member 11-like n=1 Tax=Pteropus vampyrus TaxID=132908 RepID=UPI00196AA042|nr:ATP-binding cassette sub-family C member 11-like [Pteropus giganteus]
MSFFDTTPTGRLLNCFAGNLDRLDQLLRVVMEEFLLLFLGVVLNLLMAAVLSLYILLVGVLMAILCITYYVNFKRAIDVFKSLEVYHQSPLVSHILTSLRGLSSTPVYGKTEDSVKEFENPIDIQSSYLLMFLSSTRWVALRLELMTNMVTLVVALFVTFGTSSVPYSYKAMVINLILQLAGNLQATARMCLEVEAHFTVAERILQYMQLCAPEAPLHIEGNSCPRGWPRHGDITFQDYQMRHRENTPFILRGISPTIRGREVVGIVGRTGSALLGDLAQFHSLPLFALFKPSVQRHSPRPRPALEHPRSRLLQGSPPWRWRCTAWWSPRRAGFSSTAWTSVASAWRTCGPSSPSSLKILSCSQEPPGSTRTLSTATWMSSSGRPWRRLS